MKIVFYSFLVFGLLCDHSDAAAVLFIVWFIQVVVMGIGDIFIGDNIYSPY